MLGICYICISSRFNSYSIKLVTLRLYNYNSLEKTIIGRVEKYFIRRLNIAVLDTASTPIRIFCVPINREHYISNKPTRNRRYRVYPTRRHKPPLPAVGGIYIAAERQVEC